MKRLFKLFLLVLFIFVIISTICLMSGIFIFYVANNVPPIIELNGKSYNFKSPVKENIKLVAKWKEKDM